MRTLVTGGAGFIGSHLVDRLIGLGYKVAVLDNLRSGRKENINKIAKFFDVNILSKKNLQKVFLSFKPELVFHLAAQNEVPYSMDHPEEDLKVNILGSLNLLEACKALKVKRVIYSNTGGAFYGDVPENKLPIKEETPNLFPTSFYGVSKACAENYFRLYGNIFGVTYVSLRYSNVYGPRQDGNKEAGVVAIFTQKLLYNQQPTINGDGKHTRDYIYVGDVVEANIKAIKFGKNDFFNISTGVRTSNLKVFETIEDELNTGIKPNFGPVRPGDPLHNSLSPKKADIKLRWKPKTVFQKGIKETIEYYLKKSPD